MMGQLVTDFDKIIALRLHAESRPLSQRWLEQLNEILSVDRQDIFPTDELLDHIPLLIQQIAAYIGAPEVEELAANSAVVSKARELGMLRHTQKASVHQLLREYHLLGAILEAFLHEELDRLPDSPDPKNVLMVAARVSHALRILQQTTIDTFIAEYTDQISAQQARLESFNRLVSHELRQPLGALQFAVKTLRSPVGEGPERRARLLEIVERNAQQLVDLTAQLERVARLRETVDEPGGQEVDVGMIAKEVVRQLRDMADHRGVETRIAEDLPVVITDMARIELILMNLIANAIKYSDPAKPLPYVEVFLSGATDDGRTICIRDNGLGIAAADVPHIFESFFRARPDAAAATQSDVKSSGLGLAIVAECVEAIGARISVASVEGEGTAFDLWLPLNKPAKV
jgi:signal transduction histidine kinase